MGVKASRPQRYGFERHAGRPPSVLASLALILPSLAVSTRRFHDIGRTGWWLLIQLVPIVGTKAASKPSFLETLQRRNDGTHRISPSLTG
ncbi:MAG: DUF805 domain-containing protein [Hyphomicrobiales bacterium]|nr:DUF805 domain-containing protein [Hyphomicrobiales bacterium]